MPLVVEVEAGCGNENGVSPYQKEKGCCSELKLAEGEDGSSLYNRQNVRECDDRKR